MRDDGRETTEEMSKNVAAAWKRKEGCARDDGSDEKEFQSAKKKQVLGIVTQLWVKERSLLRGLSIGLRVSVVLCHSYSPIKP